VLRLENKMRCPVSGVSGAKLKLATGRGAGSSLSFLQELTAPINNKASTQMYQDWKFFFMNEGVFELNKYTGRRNFRVRPLQGYFITVILSIFKPTNKTPRPKFEKKRQNAFFNAFCQIKFGEEAIFILLLRQRGFLSKYLG
jgi:hypothetical protein